MSKDDRSTLPSSFGFVFIVLGFATMRTLLAASVFSTVGSMSVARVNHTATLLSNGSVLVVGGVNEHGLATGAELFETAGSAFSQVRDPVSLRSLHTATLLNDGRVLIVGGLGRAHMLVRSAEIYDPRSRSFSTAGVLNFPRYWHRATLMSDGRVLITGGYGVGVMVRQAEIYDPVTNRFTVVGNLAFPRANHVSLLLPSGNVLLAGGMGDDVSSAPVKSTQWTAEIFDVKQSRFLAVGQLHSGRLHGVVLPDGRAALLGDDYYGSSELFDEATGQFTKIAGPSDCLRFQTTTLLKNGTVALIGGVGCPTQMETWGHILSSIALFDPATNQFSAAGNLTTPRYSHTATLLPDGRVLIVGGVDHNGVVLSSAELFSP